MNVNYPLNRMQEKKHTVIPIDLEKELETIQHRIFKMLNKLEVVRKFFRLKKSP